MAGFKCSFCNQVMSIDMNTKYEHFLGFYESVNFISNTNNQDMLKIQMFKCPNCGQISVEAIGVRGQFENMHVHIRPTSTCNQFPDYIPQQIRSDYEEASAIVSLSPKASAALSRRCLQGMIRDFWGIKKEKLADAVSELKGKIPEKQWKVIDGVRHIGNISATMEKDVNLIVDVKPVEAKDLVKLIEILLNQWYVNRHEQEQLYENMLITEAGKQTGKQPDKPE